MGKMLLAFVLALAPTMGATTEATGVADETAQESIQRERLIQAQERVDDKRPEEAIELLDQIIAYYLDKYPEGDTRWYVARDPAETLAYLVHTAAEHDRGGQAQDARVLQGYWADAYFLKGYALVELQRNAEAKDALEHALRLSPYNSNYSAELGHVYQVERNWAKAYELFAAAEDAVAFSLPDQKIKEATRAKRGMAYQLIEMGRLSEAESKLEECLKLDKDDRGAKGELEYLRKLRNSKKQENPA